MRWYAMPCHIFILKLAHVIVYLVYSMNTQKRKKNKRNTNQIHIWFVAFFFLFLYLFNQSASVKKKPDLLYW